MSNDQNVDRIPMSATDSNSENSDDGRESPGGYDSDQYYLDEAEYIGEAVSREWPEFRESPPIHGGGPYVVTNYNVQVPHNSNAIDITQARNNNDNNNNFSPEILELFEELCLACRTGDYESADKLLSTPNIPINYVDSWDYSPLILASLCGHIKIVELLLTRGAVCDRDSFEGARCIHGALTDAIRDLLISFDVSKKVDVSQPFAGHISSLLNPRGPQEQIQLQTRDLVFNFPHVKGIMAGDYRVLKCNRWLLSCRSEYFRDRLTDHQRGNFESTRSIEEPSEVSAHVGAWADKSLIVMPPTIDPALFSFIMDYIYLRTDALPLDDPEFGKLAELFQLKDLKVAIDQQLSAKDDRERSRLRNEASVKFMDTAREDMRNFLHKDIIGGNIAKEAIIDVNEEEEVDLEDLNFIQMLLDTEKTRLIESGAVPDVIVSVVEWVESDSVESVSQGVSKLGVGENNRTIAEYTVEEPLDYPIVLYYPVHRSILSRSPYFKTMLESELFLSSSELPSVRILENTHSIIHRPNLSLNHIPITPLYALATSRLVAEMVLSYLYHDDVSEIPPKLAVDLLFAAEELLLDKLKSRAAIAITSLSKHFTGANWEELERVVGYSGFDLLRIAWQIRCERLEQHITKMAAFNLQYIYDDQLQRKQLCNLIKESATRIEERQDTDTIELVDDIRYYLGKKHQVGNIEMIEVNFGDTEEPGDIKVYKKALAMLERDESIIDSLLEEAELEA